MIGRAGTISAGARHKKKSQFDRVYLRNYQEKLAMFPQRTIEYHKFPLALWFLGIVFLIVGLFLVWHIAFVLPDKLFSSFRRGTWWQYLVSIGISVVGVLFIMAGMITKVELNREKDLIKYSKRNIFCCRKVEKRKLSECINAQIIKRGMEYVANNTAHFKLMLYFTADRPLTIYESSSQIKIKKRYVEVASYLKLEMKLERVDIIDQSHKAGEAVPINRV